MHVFGMRQGFEPKTSNKRQTNDELIMPLKMRFIFSITIKTNFVWNTRARYDATCYDYARVTQPIWLAGIEIANYLFKVWRNNKKNRNSGFLSFLASSTSLSTSQIRMNLVSSGVKKKSNRSATPRLRRHGRFIDFMAVIYNRDLVPLALSFSLNVRVVNRPGITYFYLRFTTRLWQLHPVGLGCNGQRKKNGNPNVVCLQLVHSLLWGFCLKRCRFVI